MISIDSASVQRTENRRSRQEGEHEDCKGWSRQRWYGYWLDRSEAKFVNSVPVIIEVMELDTVDFSDRKLDGEEEIDRSPG